MNKKIADSLLQKIERLDAFEERMEIRLENFSIKVEGEEDFTIFFEIHPINSTTINSNFSIECVIYGHEGSILCKRNNGVYAESFFGFEVVDMLFFESAHTNEIGKIRIYPKK